MVSPVANTVKEGERTSEVQRQILDGEENVGIQVGVLDLRSELVPGDLSKLHGDTSSGPSIQVPEWLVARLDSTGGNLSSSDMKLRCMGHSTDSLQVIFQSIADS